MLLKFKREYSDKTIMDSKLLFEKRDILLFQYQDKKVPYSHLKSFTQFLACTGTSAPLSFSHGDSEGFLISDLTLRENICLDLFWNRLEEKNFCLSKFFAEHDNRHLNEFFCQISLLDEYPRNVDNRMRKMTSLVRTLLRPSRYLFLESPEKYLSGENLDIFFKAVDCERWKSGLTVLVFSNKNEALKEYVNKDVFCAENQRFVVKPRLTFVPGINSASGQIVQDSEGLLEFTFQKSSKKKVA